MAVTVSSYGCLCSDTGANCIVKKKKKKRESIPKRTRFAVLNDAGYSGVLFSFGSREEMSAKDSMSLRCVALWDASEKLFRAFRIGLYESFAASLLFSFQFIRSTTDRLIFQKTLQSSRHCLSEELTIPHFSRLKPTVFQSNKDSF